jgi:hypothetical protein
MAEWLRRQPAKLMGYARVGSNPTVVDFFFCLVVTKQYVHESVPTDDVGHQNKRGDARIELATSCTLSKNHTTRPITLVTKKCVRRELNPGPSLGKRRS